MSAKKLYRWKLDTAFGFLGVYFFRLVTSTLASTSTAPQIACSDIVSLRMIMLNTAPKTGSSDRMSAVCSGEVKR